MQILLKSRGFVAGLYGKFPRTWKGESAGEWGKRSSEGWGVRAQMWGQVIGGGGGG